MRTSPTWYAVGLVVALGTTLVIGFGIAALGIVGDGGPPDLLYAGALAVGAVGVAVARLRPHGMALALGATAVAVLLAGAVAVAAGLAEDDQTLDVFWLSAGFAGLFGLAAWAFERSDGARHVARPR
ncbi:hypothetical protein RB608_02585 [Nocardioides sp. LHD-245]|uniref:hypothetical protein n=1 Tax=Nocardioides sp. LHD-245 TaxID=3051387 RepID=UPI0027E0B34A|nr:hypothetical protein [Nocardioides sp. LHD-245]